MELNECIVCYSFDGKFLNCRHIVCDRCLPKLISPLCPYCRAFIHRSQVVFEQVEPPQVVVEPPQVVVEQVVVEQVVVEQVELPQVVVEQVVVPASTCLQRWEDTCMCAFVVFGPLIGLGFWVGLFFLILHAEP